MKLKVTTLNNLIEILSLMAAAFGSKELAAKHRNALNTYVLNVNYDELKFNTDIIVGGSATSSVTGVAVCGMAIVGNS